MVAFELGTAETERLGKSLWMLRLIGDHDLATAPTVHEALRPVRETGTTMVVDFTDTTFVDSTVIGALVNESNHSENLLLVVPRTAPVRRSLDVLGLTSLLQTFETTADALRAAPPGEQPP
jgi:anti-anti-sigma factor